VFGGDVLVAHAFDFTPVPMTRPHIFNEGNPDIQTLKHPVQLVCDPQYGASLNGPL
jgi:hypothetical protein